MAKKKIRFDTKAKRALLKWPSITSSLWPPSRPGGSWLRAQPVDGASTGPRLMAAGTEAFKTQPDGLWVFIAKADGFADCVAIEVCGSRQNFMDKRSRYQPSTTATVLHCPRRWLLGQVHATDSVSIRWQFAQGIDEAPDADIQLPARFVRVLYFLEDGLYRDWRSESIPASHEFVASYASIGSYSAQSMQRFLRRMSPEQHFYTRRHRKKS
ncbi:hypothetical protein [Corallococcus sicarius]|uniref:hypothetical protein n=1 Tax=Corallococcus sicarius TaxID=2316726 RepID=UPI0011C442D6|nr:hypothetical protein [Corallococcus sicarius]